MLKAFAAGSTPAAAAMVLKNTGLVDSKTRGVDGANAIGSVAPFVSQESMRLFSAAMSLS